MEIWNINDVKFSPFRKNHLLAYCDVVGVAIVAGTEILLCCRYT